MKNGLLRSGLEQKHLQQVLIPIDTHILRYRLSAPTFLEIKSVISYMQVLLRTDLKNFIQIAD